MVSYFSIKESAIYEHIKDVMVIDLQRNRRQNCFYDNIKELVDSKSGQIRPIEAHNIRMLMLGWACVVMAILKTFLILQLRKLL